MKKLTGNMPKQEFSGKKVRRSAEGLRDALFDEMDALNEGKSVPAMARAKASISNSIMKSVSMEIEMNKYVISLEQANSESCKFGSLQLGSVKAE